LRFAVASTGRIFSISPNSYVSAIGFRGGRTFRPNAAKMRRTSNAMTRMPSVDPEIAKRRHEESFQSLVYRYFFFQWLFLDMTRATGPIELRAAWEHNQRQRKWLPRYMRRWAILSTAGFALGAVSERALGAPVFAVCWYTGACISFAVLVVVAAMWLFLGRNERP
jgi:hypothetical protein